MNDAVVFAMLFAEQIAKNGGRLNCNREQIIMVNQEYDGFCDWFYINTRWEYDTPDYTEIILGMSKYLEENVFGVD